MTKLVFIDTETTSLRPDRRAWEIGMIMREPGTTDREWSWLIDTEDLDLGNADPFSLKIGKFYDRHQQAFAPNKVSIASLIARESDVLRHVEFRTRGAILVGAVPNFDAEVLAARMRAHGICPSWHYHLVDVETLAAGKLGLAPPWDFDKVLDAFGLTYDEADRHTALGDARMARDLYDEVLRGSAEERSDDPSKPSKIAEVS